MTTDYAVYAALAYLWMAIVLYLVLYGQVEDDPQDPDAHRTWTIACFWPVFFIQGLLILIIGDDDEDDDDDDDGGESAWKAPVQLKPRAT